MDEMDLTFTSTSSTEYIVNKNDLEARQWAQRESPCVFIDISVPRNVEASCNDIPGVTAYNVDDLKQVLEENKAKRQNAIREAEVRRSRKLFYRGCQTIIISFAARSRLYQRRFCKSK